MRHRLALFLLLLSAPHGLLAQEQPPAAPPPERRVFAHYMLCYFNSVAFYKQEIELAQRHGIEGFALNVGQWLLGPDKPSNYVPAAERMYQAARELDSDFKIFFSIDVTGIRNFPLDITDMVKRFADHPNQFYHQERQVISTYAGSASGFASIIGALKDDGHPLFFVPNLSHQRHSANRSFESTLRLLDHDHIDGLYWFGPDATVTEILQTNATMARACTYAGKLFMAGVTPSYNSPNLRDHYGIEGYAAQWEGIIRDGTPWVEIVTWSDYNEDSHLMPYRWGHGREKWYNDRDESLLDANGYLAAWFASETPPAITQDKIYYTYRNRSIWLRRAWDHTKEEWIEDITLTAWPFDQIHDDAEDNIYITTMLTAPATLRVAVGDRLLSAEQPAGMAHQRVPLASGVPRFSLTRAGQTLLDFTGRQRIITKPEEQTTFNSIKGYHLNNRTWTGGDVAGPARRLAAADGELTGGAEQINHRGVRAVRNAEQHASGVLLPVSGLETATYAVRIRYANATDRDARLTLTADGPPREEKDYPYYLPLFLPATGGEFATTSFLWSLYDTTTFLHAQWMENPAFKQNEQHPLRHDYGQVIIEHIELVQVEPVSQPQPAWETTMPEMVAIPGGSFTMGSNASHPDEAPAHRVTLAPFSIGRYEVTNREYERFDPKHRELRDMYSWRDREPVIYVSWRDAVNYCNWLSAQHNLTPAYSEVEVEVQQGNATRKVKQWQFDEAATGFRLPTEAQWEYVAAGRDQQRRYPWGDTKPIPGHHGRFQGQAALSADPRLPATFAAGVTVVGSYPAGASRDGVHDLAGNVAEWCSDWFQLYTPEAKENPHVDEPSNYRSIRGNSWGYYGLSPHATDREFNNPNYPGYVYLGFRVVLPQH